MFMVVMYETKDYGIGIDHCLYWGMLYSMQLVYLHMYVLGLSLYHRPQLIMVIPFGISKFFDVCSPL